MTSFYYICKFVEIFTGTISEMSFLLSRILYWLLVTFSYLFRRPHKLWGSIIRGLIFLLVYNKFNLVFLSEIQKKPRKVDVDNLHIWSSAAIVSYIQLQPPMSLVQQDIQSVLSILSCRKIYLMKLVHSSHVNNFTVRYKYATLPSLFPT